MEVGEQAIEYVDCAICGADRAEFLFEARDWTYGRKGSFPVVRCEDCGLVYLNPRIRSEGIKLFYPQDYYAHQSSAKKRGERGTRLAGLKSGLQRLVLQEVYGYEVEPPKRNSGWLSLLHRWIAVALKNQGTYLSRMLPRKEGGKLLDVGCGNGSYLSQMKDLGWETYGVEINEQACVGARSLGHEVVCGELIDAQYESEFFDAVTMWHVLEHVHNPVEILSEVHRLLKVGGIFALSVPNFESIYSRLFHDKWFMFTAPLHYYHYSFSTLERLLRETDFQIRKTYYPLGRAGLSESIKNCLRARGWSEGTISRLRLVEIALRWLDRLTPKGHIFVHALRTSF